jgi:putative phage-type endonuclease
VSDFDVQAWHEWRRGGVGGSDIAALIGLSNYASPTSLFYEKAGLLERDEESPRQRMAKRMEAVLAAEFNDATGLFVAGEQTWCQHSQHPWARCTVDGFVADSPYGSPGLDGDLSLGTWEAKTDARFGWPDGVPPNIRAQCVWQMAVTQLQHCWITVMFGGFRIEHYEIHWDDDAQSDFEFMFAAASDFWKHVQTGTPPPVDDHWATTEALTQVYRDPDGMLDADDHGRELVATIQRAMAITAAAEATEKRWKNELRAMLADKTDLVDGTKPGKRKDDPPQPRIIASWREQESHRIDPELVRTLVPLELVEKVTTTTTSRVLRVSKPKETE